MCKETPWSQAVYQASAAPHQSSRVCAHRYQKIHWKAVKGSMEGSAGIEVDNRGEVRFTKTSQDSCKVRLGAQFEVPEPLAPFAVLLVPLCNDIVTKDMQSFAEYAGDKYAAAKAAAASAQASA